MNDGDGLADAVVVHGAGTYGRCTANPSACHQGVQTNYWIAFIPLILDVFESVINALRAMNSEPYELTFTT